MTIAKKIILVILVIILSLPVFYILNKVSYRYRVDDLFKEKVKNDLRSVSGSFSKDILLNPLYQDMSEAIQWNNQLVRLEEKSADETRVEDTNGVRTTYTTAHGIPVIEMSSDNGKTWNALHEFEKDTNGCFIGIIYQEKINCIIGESDILFFDKNGTFVKNAVQHQIIDGSEYLAAYTKDNKLVFLWSDHRAQIPLPTISPPFFYGPEVIMAGELNLDTLEFKEHVIGYDKYDLQDLFGKDFLLENKK